MTHIAIIGAGITGVTTAYALLDRGDDVTVFDRQRYAAMDTSFANGGQLSASNAEVWNSWGTVSGHKWLLKASPLSLNPRPNWHKYSWLAEFVANIPNYERNTVATTRLAIEARRHLFAMANREKIDFDLEQRGILHIYRDRAGFEHAARVNPLLRRGGLERHAVTPAEMRAIEPALDGNFHGGFFTPSDATGDIHKFTPGSRRPAAARGDASVDAAVDGCAGRGSGTPRFEVAGRAAGRRPAICPDLSFDGVVICAGLASRARGGARRPGEHLSGEGLFDHGRPRRGEPRAAPWVSLLDEGTKIVSSRLGEDRFRVAGTAEFNGENRDIRADRIEPLVDWTRRLFPGLDTSRVVPWCGIAPDDARHDAARRPRPPARRVLQYRPRPSGMDAVGRDRRDRGRCRGAGGRSGASPGRLGTGAPALFEAIRAASSIAAIKLSGRAMPCPAMSSAVP